MTVEKVIAALPGMSAQERDKVRVNAQNALSSAGDELKDAASRVIQALDELGAAEHQQLVDRLNGMDVASRVVEAFRAQPMTETEAKLVQVLLDHPGSSSTELSRALGWGGQSWHMHFGVMCADRAVYLWPAPKSETREVNFYSGILADWSAEGQWRMKPDVTAAFVELGLRAS